MLDMTKSAANNRSQPTALFQPKGVFSVATPPELGYPASATLSQNFSNLRYVLSIL